MRSYASPSSRRFRHSPGRAGFSLTEIVTVVAVMAVLTGLTAASLRPLGAYRLASAGNAVADMVNLARQDSISKNTYSAVVVKSQSTDAYAAYCVVELQLQNDGSFNLGQLLTPWQRLPQGIYFSDSPSNSFLAGSDASSATINSPASLAYLGQQLNLATATVLHIYRPDGCLQVNQPLRLRLIEGSLNSSGTVTPRQTNPANQPGNYYDVLIVRDTGEVKIERP